MKTRIELFAAACLIAGGAIGEDLMSDTWSATDGEGRVLPTAAEVGLPRPGRTVALFYFLTHGSSPQTPGPFDMAKILAADPKALEHDSPLLGGLYAPHYWAEPLFGYYRNDDPFVIRKHAQMLGDAGVDVIVFDVTNGPTFDDRWEAILKEFSAVRAAGGKTPQVAFMCPFQPNPPPDRRGREVRHLWNVLYSKGRCSDLWFRWAGKPLIIAHPSYCAPEAVTFGNAKDPKGRYPARLEKGHTLGQRFTSEKPFGSVGIDTPTYGTHTGCAATLRLREKTPTGRILAERRFEGIADNEHLEMVLPATVPAGTYVLELADVAGSVGWWSSRPLPGNTFAGAMADGRPQDGWRSFECRAPEDDESKKMREFFTFRRPVPGYHEKNPIKDGWSWLEVHPQHVYSDEMMSVGVAQNAKKDRKCAMSEPGAMGRRWHEGANDPDPKALARGPNFQEQWNQALAADPRLVFVTGWNEWTASRFPAWGGFSQPGGVYPDIFNPEFSRDCEPTKILFGDAYYWQLVSNVRRYKGVRSVPVVRSAPIRIDGAFDDWRGVEPTFRDTIGDEVRRDFEGVAKAGRYVDQSGRNDIVAAKVSKNGSHIFFFVETRNPLSAPTEGTDWMRLFVDIDRSAKTGWLGYDFLVERDKTGYIVRRHEPQAKKWGQDWGWSHPVSRAEWALKGNALELAVPVSAFGKAFRSDGFDFKWEDHALQAYDWTDFTLHGDTAPNDRYNYRAVFSEKPPSNPYGTTSHLTRTGYWDREKLCSKYGSAGAKKMRMDFDWRTLERTPGRWDFTRYDEIIATAEQNGVQIVGILTSPPKWADPVWKHLDKWAAFVRTTATRYRGRLHAYEIWNEEDAEGFWGYTPNATNYVALLRKSYETLKAVDPGIRVAIGSFTTGGLPFCEGCYAAGAKDCFDIMNVHPYSVYGRPGNSDPEGFVDVWLGKLRKIMSKYDDADKEIWITEIGWPSPPELGFKAPGVLKDGLKAIDPVRKRWKALVIDNVFLRPAGCQTLLDKILAELPAGSTAEGCSFDDTAKALAAVKPDLLVVTPHVQQFPIQHDRAILDFSRKGGVIAEFGGMPFYEGPKCEKRGSLSTEELRKALRLAPHNWWMKTLPAVPKSIQVFPTAAAPSVKSRKEGYACPRFIDERYLQKGDVFTPLLTATWTNGVNCIGAAAIRFAQGGGVVYNGMFEAPFGTFSERDQAAYVARSHLLAFNEGVSTVMWYELRSHDFDRQDEGWGLLHLDLSEKMAWPAYKTLIAQRPAGSIGRRRPAPTDGLWRSDWTLPDGRAAGAVWTTESPHVAALDLGPGDYSFVDFLGHPLSAKKTGDLWQVPVSSEVVYFSANRETMTYGRNDLPQTWFHLIGGNVSKKGLTADLEALAQVGVGGIQFFHGQMGSAYAWPRTHEQIPCLSERWTDIVRHAADECERLGLTFEMQNCPGWSMSGGPWITHETAMRKIVAFRPGEKPAFGPDDDYRDIGTVEFPAPAGWGEADPVPCSVQTNGDRRVYSYEKAVTVRTLELPSPQSFNHAWGYEPALKVTLEALTASGVWQKILERDYPRGCWQDNVPVTFALPETTASSFRLTFIHRHPIAPPRFVRLKAEARLDCWEALAGRVFRDLPPRGQSAAHYRTNGQEATLVFGSVNMKVKNGPAPEEARGWECDKLDPRGFSANFEGYLGRLLKGPLAGGKLKGMVVDSWECLTQTWTPRLEEYFKRMNGYDLRPHLPTLFGYGVGKNDERFLLDWRRTLSRLVEENYYRVFAEMGRKNGLKVQFETAFQDVLAGDPLRYWKYADIPMCEFWQPFDNAEGHVGSDNFKPVRSCVSAAHVYGKRRIQAEALTSMRLDWDEDFDRFKRVIDHHLARGVTHLVLHTYTHNPQTGKDFLPPGTSFAWCIGSPFLRGQTWWRFMPLLTSYAARCGHELERGQPVVDVLWYLGDDHAYRPDENAPFPKGYKYDYVTQDALLERVSAKDGRLVLPDGLSYRMLWIPQGTFLLPQTEKKIVALEQAGAKICRGELKIDWESPLKTLVGRAPEELEGWYQRKDGNEDIFFLVEKDGSSQFVYVKDGQKRFGDPQTGKIVSEPHSIPVRAGGTSSSLPFDLAPLASYPAWATERVYAGSFSYDGKGAITLDLGVVKSWAEVCVNGKTVRTLWSSPYVCNLTPFLKKGTNEIRVKVTSTWFNALVHDAGLPEKDRTTWTIRGPAANAPFRPAGLLGPVKVLRR